MADQPGKNVTSGTASLTDIQAAINSGVRALNNLIQVITAGKMQFAPTTFSLTAPLTLTSPTYAMGPGDVSLINNGSATLTVTLLAPASYPGRLIFCKTHVAFAVNSASANVVGLTGGAAANTILAATAGKWAILQSDGTSWQIMAAN